MSRVVLPLLLALLALALAPTPVLGQAAEPAAGVRERLEQPAVLRGRFEQEKQIQGFKNPLRSSGGFLLLREHGVAWDTTAPFASSAVLTRERLATRLPDGSERILIDAADGPAASATASLLMALVAGDLDALAQRFEIEQTLLENGGWRLRLLPREAALKRVFAGFTLAGDRYVRELVIEEAGGDLTRVLLLDLASEPATPTAAEVARFD
ncbi:MAG TPA: outer membrane lipoprotein carrier protein LolA [Arenimonas sp.]|nr:outer membrane lipoprotein carrier protein LolA [Arenimonas sp.]